MEKAFLSAMALGWFIVGLPLLALKKLVLSQCISQNLDCTFVYNGELYNYRELKLELEALGYHFNCSSDTAVFACAFHRFGGQVFKRLRGMYAFALYDEKSRSTILGRDPLGIKPLYFAQENGRIYFSSSVKALANCGGFKTTPSSAGHVGFFLFGHIPEPYTLHKEIRSLRLVAR